jgi:hypothetical protein
MFSSVLQHLSIPTLGFLIILLWHAANIEIGSPTNPTVAQIPRSNELTRDLAKTNDIPQSGSAGSVEFTSLMNSNGVAPV